MINLVGPEAEAVWMGTFHSLCVRILRADGDKLGYQNFQIFDTTDQIAVLKDACRQS